MPQNKNAIARYIILDQLLQHKFGHTIAELTDLCNEKLEENGKEPVTKRCIEKDLLAMEGDPFYAEIDRTGSISKEGNSGKVRKVQLVRYANPYFSIFNHEMNDDEKALLRKALEPFGKFEDIPGFEQLENLIASLNVEVDESKKFVYYSVNENGTNTKVFGKLYSAISEQKVINLTYHKFDNPNPHNVLLHPYILKEWNRRWYIIAAADDSGKILTFALDRADDVEICPDMKYKPASDDLMERYEDIVGITYYEGKPIETIYFWASDNSTNYLLTKPIHGTQTMLKEGGEEETDLRKKYPKLKSGKLFRLKCMINYELIRELLSYGKGLVVLGPDSLRDTIIDHITSIKSNYSKYELNVRDKTFNLQRKKSKRYISN